MKNFDEMFYKEFQAMLLKRKAMSSMFSLGQLEVPTSEHIGTVCNVTKGIVKGVTDEYYGKLNNSEVVILPRMNLTRKKVGSNGRPIIKENRVVTEEVDVPHSCVAIVSTQRLGVPFKYQSKEKFIYVDVIKDKKGVLNYIYIIPRKYCYKLNQVALVLSLNKMRAYYGGMSLALQNGVTVYLYTIPYKPKSNGVSNQNRTYRILSTKTDVNFDKELNEILNLWGRNRYIFDFNMCTLSESVKGRGNVAFENFAPTIEVFQRYNPDVSLERTSETVDSISILV